MERKAQKIVKNCVLCVIEVIFYANWINAEILFINKFILCAAMYVELEKIMCWIPWLIVDWMWLRFSFNFKDPCEGKSG